MGIKINLHMAKLELLITNYGLVMTEFSKKLGHYRKIAGLSQTALANKIGITPTQISKYERGAAEPKPETLKKISEALNVTIEDLLSNGNKVNVLVQEHLNSMSRLNITAKQISEIENTPFISTKYLDCYLSPEADIDFTNDIKNLIYNYIKNRFGEDYSMVEILEKYNLKTIELEYELQKDGKD